MSQHCILMRVNFTHFRILIIPMRAMKYLDYLVGLIFLCSRKLPEDGRPGGGTCCHLILAMNSTLLSAFVG